MRGLADVLRGFCVLLSDVALICLAVMLVPLLSRLDISIGYEVWIVYLLLQFLISYGMMTAGVSVNLYLLVETALVAAGTWLTCRASLAQTAAVSGNRLMGELLLCVGMGAAATGIHGAWAAYRLPGSNGILRYVDCLIAALAFYLYAAYEMGETGDRRLLGIALAAVLFDLLAVNQLRTGEECPSVIQGAGTGGRLLLGIIFLLCLAVTGAVVGLASGQVHSLVDVLLFDSCRDLAGGGSGFGGLFHGSGLHHPVFHCPASQCSACSRGKGVGVGSGGSRGGGGDSRKSTAALGMAASSGGGDRGGNSGSLAYLPP